jgi:hypothetical protein
MELTQKDYDDRKARVAKGEGDDEDARLVKHYEANGFTATEGYDPDAAKAVKAEPAAPVDQPATAAGSTAHTDRSATSGRSNRK